MRFWYWSQPALAVVLLGFTIYTLVNFFAFEASNLFSIQFAVNGAFIFPGLLISLGVSQVLLSKRRPRSVALPERILLGFEFLLIAVLIATSFEPDSLTVGLVLWPLLIVLAVVISIAIVVTTARLARPAVTPEAPPTPAELDELLGQGEQES